MEYYMFKHRIPLDKVSAVNIVEGVNVNILGFIEVSKGNCVRFCNIKVLILCQSPVMMIQKVKTHSF